MQPDLSQENIMVAPPIRRFSMRTSRSLLAGLFAVALLVLPFLGLGAQGRGGGPAGNQQAAPAATVADGSKVLNLEDYGRWNRIGATAISNDGRWMLYTLTPNDGDPTLFVKALEGDKTYTVPLGAAPGGAARGGGGGRGAGGGGNAPQFSDDSRWAAHFVNPPGARGGGRSGRGGPTPTPGGRGAAPAAQTPPTPGHLELLNLATGEKVSILERRIVEVLRGLQMARRAP